MEEKIIAFNETELKIAEGNFILLCGKSGSGKTTLLNHIEKKLKEMGLKTGYVFQNFDAQIVTDKVWHELAFGMENAGLSPELMHRRVAELTSYFGITDWLDRSTQNLSGGQKQLLNLASVMALKPDYLLLDEPSSQLDPVAAVSFFNTLRKISRELGTTIIMSEHRLEDLFAQADQIVLLDKMKIAFSGTPQKTGEFIALSGNKDFMEFLPVPARVCLKKGFTQELPLTVAQGRRWFKNCVKDGNCAKGVQAAAGPEWSGFPRNSGQPDGGSRNAPAINIKKLSFKYQKNGPFILRDLDLKIEAGSIHAIVGANGSGKSTLLKLLQGLEKPLSGKICCNGKILLLCQNVRNLFMAKTVREELEESGWQKGQGFVDFDLNQHPYDLSGGEMQKLGLTKLLCQNPDVILLDEPTKGLDNVFKKELAGILKNLKEQNKTVVLVTHDLEFCAMVSDQVSMMFEGQLCGTDSAVKFFAENNFYTTACVRMSSGIAEGIVTENDL